VRLSVGEAARKAVELENVGPNGAGTARAIPFRTLEVVEIHPVNRCTFHVAERNALAQPDDPVTQAVALLGSDALNGVSPSKAVVAYPIEGYIIRAAADDFGAGFCVAAVLWEWFYVVAVVATYQ
jgi:hypothetical protein